MGMGLQECIIQDCTAHMCCSVLKTKSHYYAWLPWEGMNYLSLRMYLAMSDAVWVKNNTPLSHLNILQATADDYKDQQAEQHNFLVVAHTILCSAPNM